MRRILIKVHLWLALALGVYVVVISVSGSAVVFRGEITRWAIPRVVPDAEGEPLTGDALVAAVTEAYPDDEVLRVREGRFPRQPADVLLSRDGQEQGRLFDPYALQDMGSDFPPVVAVLEWLVSLHDDLLVFRTGRRVNGILGGVLLVVVVTGMILWWPGRRRWKQSLYIPASAPNKMWHLHSALGFWLCLLLLNWCLTSLYFAFPGPVEDFRDWLDPDFADFDRPGEALISFLVDAHFGRWGGFWGRMTWVMLGLAPALLFLSGFWVWWQRRRRRASGRLPNRQALAGSSEPVP